MDFLKGISILIKVISNVSFVKMRMESILLLMFWISLILNKECFVFKNRCFIIVLRVKGMKKNLFLD